MGVVLTLMLLYILGAVSSSYGYDPLDPKGSITVKWDLLQSNVGANDVRVSIVNNQLYRHIEAPGWRLNWVWKGKEVIWGMWGAETTEQGDCSAFKGGKLPHCCERKPVIVDLLPGAPYNIQTSNCCKAGVLSSITQDSSNSLATFNMNIGGTAANYSDLEMPENFTLGVPGYSCASAFEVPPTRFSVDGGRRWTQALRTWNVTCMYSQFLSSPTPNCCVSLSAFYNSTIVPCTKCSCNCQGLPGSKCIKFGENPATLRDQEDTETLVQCTQHMCPIRVHWHVKESYRAYWRVKITVTNFNMFTNYSLWNLVMMHPNMQSVTQVFSFNYRPLNQYSNINDTGMFWGIKYYNEMLLQAGDNGNVQTEILLGKDAEIFTFREGWVFPRRILFNGDDCVMPSPDNYPTLPNTSSFLLPNYLLSFLFFICILMILL